MSGHPTADVGAYAAVRVLRARRSRVVRSCAASHDAAVCVMRLCIISAVVVWVLAFVGVVGTLGVVGHFRRGLAL